MNRASVPRLRRTLIVLGTALATVAATLTVATTTPVAAAPSPDDYNGSDLWLRYVPVDDAKLLRDYRRAATAIVVENADATKVHRHTTDLAMAPDSREKLVETTLGAARDELVRGLGGLLGQPTPVRDRRRWHGPRRRGRGGHADEFAAGGPRHRDPRPGQGGRRGLPRPLGVEGPGRFTVIAGNTDLGALYGTFAFLRLLQTQKPIDHLRVASSPKIKHRQLNNWETERLYAGNNASGTGGLNGENGAVFNFAATGASAGRNLPVILDRYIVVARALASLGINGITINNVNADNAYLTSAHIAQEAALADALRPYGIKLALSIRYTAPTDSRFAPDTLTNAQLDPYGAAFRGWWTRKAQQIQAAIPDFMGFTVKANSEGQPGPQDFGYDHGDGANGIGAAVAPLGMTVLLAHVRLQRRGRQRPAQAGLPGVRADRRRGPARRQPRAASPTTCSCRPRTGRWTSRPREPIHPMFGRMENTNQALELQITQEYTGQNWMLTYLGPM